MAEEGKRVGACKHISHHEEGSKQKHLLRPAAAISADGRTRGGGLNVRQGVQDVCMTGVYRMGGDIAEFAEGWFWFWRASTS